MKLRWFTTGVLAVFLVLFVQSSANRVLLRDVTSITLHSGKYTTGRRASPVPQIQCVGGTAQGKFAPKAVQCYNRGFDGLDVQWEVKADLPRDYQFGRISVTCEGYDYPEDPYILAGSCGLKYELDYSSQGVHGGSYLPKVSSTNYTNIVYIIIIGFVLYLLYLTFTNTHDGNEGDRSRGFGNGYPGDGPDGRGPPPPYGWRPDNPPSYDQTRKGTSGSTQSGQSSGPGFFSGLGAGALGGYFLNNYFNRNSNTDSTFRRRNPTQFDHDTGFGSHYDQPGPSHFSSGSSTSTTHESSGFGGTERR